MQEIPPDLLRTLPTLAESWRVRPALGGRWGRGDRGDWPGAPAPPRHHLLGICVAGSRRPRSGSARGPPPPAYLLRPAPGRPPRAAKFASPAPRPDADGTAAMFAPRLLDFQKTKYAR